MSSDKKVSRKPSITDEEALEFHSMGKPGKIEINPTKKSADVILDGRIAELIYLGDHIRARLEVAGHDDFIVKVPNKGGAATVAEGREVKVGWRSEDCRALDYMDFRN